MLQYNTIMYNIVFFSECFSYTIAYHYMYMYV